MKEVGYSYVCSGHRCSRRLGPVGTEPNLLDREETICTINVAFPTCFLRILQQRTIRLRLRKIRRVALRVSTTSCADSTIA